MRKLLYQALTAILSGTVSGLVWGWALVDFEPRSFEGLPSAAQLAVMGAPVIVTFCCSAVIDWWHAKTYCLYSVVWLSWWILGSVRNDMTNTEGPLWVFLPGDLRLYLGGIIAMTLAWGLGRAVRRRCQGGARALDGDRQPTSRERLDE